MENCDKFGLEKVSDSELPCLFFQPISLLELVSMETGTLVEVIENGDVKDVERSGALNVSKEESVWVERSRTTKGGNYGRPEHIMLIHTTHCENSLSTQI